MVGNGEVMPTSATKPEGQFPDLSGVAPGASGKKRMWCRFATTMNCDSWISIEVETKQIAFDLQSTLASAWIPSGRPLPTAR